MEGEADGLMEGGRGGWINVTGWRDGGRSG
jgi:hypothetical protein